MDQHRYTANTEILTFSKLFSVFTNAFPLCQVSHTSDGDVLLKVSLFLPLWELTSASSDHSSY